MCHYNIHQYWEIKVSSILCQCHKMQCDQLTAPNRRKPPQERFPLYTKSPLRISTTKLTEYVQKSHILNIFRVYILLVIVKIPITHTENMFLLCKLFSMAIHSMCYFCGVTRLCADECKLTFLCPTRLGHYTSAQHLKICVFYAKCVLFSISINLGVQDR